MTTLSNARWEKFAQRVASGETPTAVYRSLYHVAESSAEVSGSRLAKKPLVASRITDLQQAAATETLLALADYRAFLKRVILTPVGSVAGTDLHQGFSKGGQPTMPDKLRALELDAKLSGVLAAAEKGNISVNVNVAVMSEDRRAQLMEKKRAAIERRRASLN